jgi:ribonuclease D
MSYRLIQDAAGLDEAQALLSSASRIGLDCEAAGFHRYTDRLCLVQLSTEGNTLLLDPLAVDLTDFLRPLLEDPQVAVVMHGADFDIRLLDRDLGLRVRGLFDTQIGATLLGERSIGLAALLEENFGVRLSKKHQRADWAQRPLPEALLEYAAGDTLHLMELASRFEARLQELGRWEWAQEEFRLLEETRWEENAVDPLTRVKGAHHLSPRLATALREALAWRDAIARSEDRAPFRIVGDSILMDLVRDRPSGVAELRARKGVSPRLAQRHGQALLEKLRGVDGLPEGDLRPYPVNNRIRSGRPSPDEEAQADRLRSLRTSRAEELGLERGVLLSNAVITEIVRQRPGSQGDLRDIPGLKEWQVGVLGREILGALGTLNGTLTQKKGGPGAGSPASTG